MQRIYTDFKSIFCFGLSAKICQNPAYSTFHCLWFFLIGSSEHDLGLLDAYPAMLRASISVRCMIFTAGR
jgi:hypothetical protein